MLVYQKINLMSQYHPYKSHPKPITKHQKHLKTPLNSLVFSRKLAAKPALRPEQNGTCVETIAVAAWRPRFGAGDACAMVPWCRAGAMAIFCHGNS